MGGFKEKVDVTTYGCDLPGKASDTIIPGAFEVVDGYPGTAEQTPGETPRSDVLASMVHPKTAKSVCHAVRP